MGRVPLFPREEHRVAAASPRAARADPGATRSCRRASAAAPLRPSVPVLALCGAALLLEGCGNSRKCKIPDVYGLLQVDGKTGLSKRELDEKGVRLCARHIGKKDSYKDSDLCSHPDEIFPSGEMAEVESADGQAMLLVRCPSADYPRGRDMQRVTCGSSGSFYYDDGDEAKVMFLFDSTRHPTNCQTQAHPAASQEVMAHAPLRKLASHESEAKSAVGALPGAHPARARVGAKPVLHAGGDPLISPAGSWEGLTGEAATDDAEAATDDAEADAAADVDDETDDEPADGDSGAAKDMDIVLAAGAGSAGVAAVLVQPSGDVLPARAPRAARPAAAALVRPERPLGVAAGGPAAVVELLGGVGGPRAPEASLLEMPSGPEVAKAAGLLETPSRPVGANGSAQGGFSEADLLARLERTRLLLESR